jgi:glycosyltransferase involved in cell wall biosynthesis
VPSFSVIIPAYQAVDTVADAVVSALDQSATPLEVIVCDDGSTDGTAAAIEPFRDRVVLLRKENGGVASARNLALRAAGGDFIAPLDSDDVFLPRRLQALGELAAARPDLDLLSTDVYLERDGQTIARYYAENPFEVTDQRTAILRSCFVGWPAARRERLLAIGGFDESLVTGEDWDAWIRMVLDGARAGLVEEPLLRYRLRPGSLTSNRPRVLRERVVLLEKTARHPALRYSEREALAAARRRANARACLAEAKEVFLEGRATRSRAVALARCPGARIRDRLFGVAMLLMPRALGRTIAARAWSDASYPRRATAARDG